jgi:glucose-1-phosphate cytidylyltransferase
MSSEVSVKVAILAGGVGSRLAEETELKPKPMVEIGGKPILWHIMMHYSHYGFSDFIIALGYKGEVIKKYMIDYSSLNRDLTVEMRTGAVTFSHGSVMNWRVDLVDTGMNTMTGGRIRRLERIVGNETFMLTWGDGVSDVNLHKLLSFHRSHGKLATLTAVRPTARFGHLEMNGDAVVEFSEKPQTAEGWINGAFFVLQPEVFDYIEGDETQWEREPLEQLAREGQLMAYRHQSFWQCMDTLREKKYLENLWASGNAPWKVWRDDAYIAEVTPAVLRRSRTMRQASPRLPPVVVAKAAQVSDGSQNT